VIAGFDQLVRDSPQMPINPLGVFLRGVDGFARLYPGLVFPGNGVFSISPV